jgi:hypothetical protein
MSLEVRIESPTGKHENVGAAELFWMNEERIHVAPS